MLLNNSKKIVIKLGSSTIVDKKGIFKEKWASTLIKDIKKLKKKQRHYNSFFWCYCIRTKLLKN